LSALELSEFIGRQDFDAYRCKHGWKKYHRQKCDGLHNLIIYAGEHVEGLDRLVSYQSLASPRARLGYEVDFSLQPLVGGLRSSLQASHHLQLKGHVLLRLVLVCVGEAWRQELEASLLQADQLFHRLDSDVFDFHKVINVPQQVLQHLKAVDFIPILQQGQLAYC
jgi:hypothetical protein